MRLQNDPPTRRSDPILALKSEYFYACEVLHSNVVQERELFSASAEKQEVHDRFVVYLSHWLSSLWVVANAFRYVLKLRDRSIDGFINLHLRELSDFRNATYHYHRSSHKQITFFSSFETMEWAEELHREFRRYFHEYEAQLASFYPEIPYEEWPKR